ncbi:MAG: OmpA family protein [Bacteroidales bacterium]
MKYIICQVLLFFCTISTSSFAQSTQIKHFNFNDTVFNSGDFHELGRDLPFMPRCWPSSNDTTFKYLDSFVSLLLKNQCIIKIEIAVYTDNRRIPLTKDTLSKRMAEGLKDYLILQGVKSDRIEARGYGGNYPCVIEKDTLINYPLNIYNQECRETSVFLKKNSCLDDEFIKTFTDKCEKEIIYSLNRRVLLKILTVEK